MLIVFRSLLSSSRRYFLVFYFPVLDKTRLTFVISRRDNTMIFDCKVQYVSFEKKIPWKNDLNNIVIVKIYWKKIDLNWSKVLRIKLDLFESLYSPKPKLQGTEYSCYREIRANERKIHVFQSVGAKHLVWDNEKFCLTGGGEIITKVYYK